MPLGWPSVRWPTPGTPGLASPRTPAAQRARIESCSSRWPGRSGSAAGRRCRYLAIEGAGVVHHPQPHDLRGLPQQGHNRFQRVMSFVPGRKIQPPRGSSSSPDLQGEKCRYQRPATCNRRPDWLQAESSSSRPDSGISVLTLRALTAPSGAKGIPTPSFDQ